MIIPNDTCSNYLEEGIAGNINNVFCSGDSESYKEQMTFDDAMLDHTVRFDKTQLNVLDIQIHFQSREKCSCFWQSSHRSCVVIIE
jgi:hypothetical protein